MAQVFDHKATSMSFDTTQVSTLTTRIIELSWISLSLERAIGKPSFVCNVHLTYDVAGFWLVKLSDDSGSSTTVIYAKDFAYDNARSLIDVQHSHVYKLIHSLWGNFLRMRLNS